MQRYPLLLALSLLLQLPEAAPAQSASEELICVPPQTQIFDKPVCSWTKELSSRCEAQAPESIFAQCNVFKLVLNKDIIRTDDDGNSYQSAIFKFSETNACGTGDESPISHLTGRCDTFATYAQFFRNTNSNKCYAMVNSALLGDQLMELGIRNNPHKKATKIEIPGISRRIIFTPSSDSRILKQSNASLIRSIDTKRPFSPSGQAIGPLQLLALESPLTTQPENLKPNPAKIRITRGRQQESKDFLDIHLNRSQEISLNSVLKDCK